MNPDCPEVQSKRGRGRVSCSPGDLAIFKHYVIVNLQKAEVQEEEEAKGRIKVIVLGEAGLQVFLQLVVRFLHLGSQDHFKRRNMEQFNQAHLNYGSKMINPGSKKDLTYGEDDAKVENHKAAERELKKNKQSNERPCRAYQIIVYGINAGLSHMK